MSYAISTVVLFKDEPTSSLGRLPYIGAKSKQHDVISKVKTIETLQTCIHTRREKGNAVQRAGKLHKH